MEVKVESQSVVNPAGMWTFVLNPILIEADLPFELAPDCFIDKASKEQRIRIKEELSKFSLNAISGPMHRIYENELIIEPIVNGHEFKYEPLQESEWRYYVVTTPDNGQNNINLHYVSNISDVPLELGALHFYNFGGMGWNQAILQNQFEFGNIRTAQRVNKENLIDLSKTYLSFMEIIKGISGKDGFPEILRAMRMFDSLRVLPSNSEFHVLGLFSIIEMLITHNPKLEDRGDSITHQMQSKIPLLSRRFERPLSFSNFFVSNAEKKIWAALYAYRSALAHGGLPDFQRELKILKDAKNAKSFLNDVVKALIRHSLREPQLYKDLRGC